MAEHRAQFRVSSLTSTTGVTLVPKVGELKDAVLNGVSIEMTFTTTPDYFTLNKIVDLCIEAK